MLPDTYRKSMLIGGRSCRWYAQRKMVSCKFKSAIEVFGIWDGGFLYFGTLAPCPLRIQQPRSEDCSILASRKVSKPGQHWTL